MITQAVILAGGKGTRLRPYTTILPKPLMPLGDMPILEILLTKLRNAGINRVIIATGYLDHIIRAYFGDGSNFGVQITYSHENEPMGTAGPLRLMEDLLDSSFLMMNGDLLTDLQFKNLIKFHTSSNSEGTVCAFKTEVQLSLGVLVTDENDQIINYIEKPKYEFDVSMGIYAMNKSIISLIPENTFFDLPDLIMKIKETKKIMKIYKHRGQWLDVGRHDDYSKAIELFETEKRNEFLR